MEMRADRIAASASRTSPVRAMLLLGAPLSRDRLERVRRDRLVLDLSESTGRNDDVPPNASLVFRGSKQKHAEQKTPRLCGV